MSFKLILGGHHFCGLQIKYQESLISSDDAGFAGKNYAIVVRRKLREEEDVIRRFPCLARILLHICPPRRSLCMLNHVKSFLVTHMHNAETEKERER
jgi:hypothetical protein